MTLPTDSTKRSSRYECYEQEIKSDGEKEEQEVPNSPCDILREQSSNDSPLDKPALKQCLFLADKNGSGPRSPLADQGASSRQEDAVIHDLSRNRSKDTFLSDDGNGEAVADLLDTGGEQDHERKRDPKSKEGDTNSKFVDARLLTEEEKIRERTRKGRERSLRTRRRNIARLKLLEANCAHFAQENKVLRELARSLGDEDTEGALEFFKQYKLLKKTKPEPHRLSQSESFYLALLSPLSETASTATRETRSKKLNAAGILSKAEHPLIPCTYKGLPNKHSSEGPKLSHAEHEVSAPLLQMSARDVSNISIAGENNVSSADVFRSVFADPAYCDERDLGFSIEDLYKQPPLSVEEIIDLLEEGRGSVEFPRL